MTRNNEYTVLENLERYAQEVILASSSSETALPTTVALDLEEYFDLQKELGSKVEYISDGGIKLNFGLVTIVGKYYRNLKGVN